MRTGADDFVENTARAVEMSATSNKSFEIYVNENITYLS